MSLVWVRSNAQTTANLVAASVALEQARNAAASGEYLLESARAAAARNGYEHGVDAVQVELATQDGQTAVRIERGAPVYFLRMIRPEPVPVRAMATVEPAVVKAGL